MPQNERKANERDHWVSLYLHIQCYDILVFYLLKKINYNVEITCLQLQEDNWMVLIIALFIHKYCICESAKRVIFFLSNKTLSLLKSR